jgi:hypothetical protein
MGCSPESRPEIDEGPLKGQAA